MTTVSEIQLLICTHFLSTAKCENIWKLLRSIAKLSKNMLEKFACIANLKESFEIFISPRFTKHVIRRVFNNLMLISYFSIGVE